MSFLFTSSRVTVISSDTDSECHSPAVLPENDTVQMAADLLMNQSGQRQKKIPRLLWAEEPIQQVTSLPFDIDGITVYNICSDTRDNLLDSLRDGRNWLRDNRTDWSGYKSVRYRDCAGGFTCPNTECVYLKEFRHFNCVSFDKDGLCQYCFASGTFKECEARKYIAFSSENKATVYHYGNHSCQAKGVNHRPGNVVKKAISQNISTKPSQIQSMAILSDLRARKDWSEVRKTVRAVSSVKTISNEKQKQKKIMQPNGNGFDAIVELKKYTDKQDPFMINVISANKEFIFKTSTEQMKIAARMNTDGEHFMSKEFCHFDGNHKRVKSYVTLTASVYHPLLRKQIVLATMNCKHEDIEYVLSLIHI